MPPAPASVTCIIYPPIVEAHPEFSNEYRAGWKTLRVSPSTADASPLATTSSRLTTSRSGPLDGPGGCPIRASAHKPDGWRPEPARGATPDQTHPSAAAATPRALTLTGEAALSDPLRARS